MAKIQFQKSGYTTIEFSRGLEFPVEKTLRKHNNARESGGKKLFVYKKGISVEYFPLKFRSLTQTDKNNARNWFDTIADGALNTFTYVDENGTSHTVRWVEAKNEFSGQEFHEIMHSWQKYGLVILLRKEV